MGLTNDILKYHNYIRRCWDAPLTIDPDITGELTPGVVCIYAPRGNGKEAHVGDITSYKNLLNQSYGASSAFYFSTKENEMERDYANSRKVLTTYLASDENPLKRKEPLKTNSRQIHIGVIDEDYYIDKKEVNYISDLYGKEFPDLVDRVIINEPATIIIWKDGSKTIVKCTENDIFNTENGIAMCIVKKLFMDSSTRMNKFMDKWIPEDTRYDCRPLKLKGDEANDLVEDLIKMVDIGPADQTLRYRIKSVLNGYGVIE